jgi:hypothetical protein
MNKIVKSIYKKDRYNHSLYNGYCNYYNDGLKSYWFDGYWIYADSVEEAERILKQKAFWEHVE